MKIPQVVAVIFTLASGVYAQEPGFFVNVGGGLARMEAGNFTQTTSYGEVLRTTKKGDAVGFVQIGFGYQIDENWDVVANFADYATAEVKVGFPSYPGVNSILPMPAYSRNVLRYDTIRFALIPSYTYALNDRLRLRGRAGVTCNQTDSHFETTYHAWFSGRPDGTFAESLMKERKRTWSYLVSLGAEYSLSQNLSLGLSGAYAPFKIKVTPTNVVGLGSGSTQPSKKEVNIDSFEGTLSLVWRR
jgi:opacity protein-like surface antigen